jgi:hypothetical protein
MKKVIGKLVSVKFTDRKEPLFGFVLDYTDDWTIMRKNVVDYVLDGYVIFAHKKIKGWRRSAEEKFKEQVILLKGYKPEKGIPISNLQVILHALSRKHEVFQFSTKEESVCYLGRLISVDEKVLVIDYLDPKGKFTGERTFKVKDIRTIEFDTDYINSLKLVAKKG